MDQTKRYLKQLPGTAVVLDRLEVVASGDAWFVAATSSEGAVGYSLSNSRLPDILSLFSLRIAPFFVGKDMRDIEAFIDEAYTWRTNYKYESMPYWCAFAHAETAILDLLGKTAGLSIGRMLGGSRRDSLPVYLSSMRRDTAAEAELDYVAARLAETGARACKMKIGGRMSGNADSLPGRTERLVALAKKTLGKDIAVYLDANSSYSPDRAIGIGRMLEAEGIDLFEEPVPWLDFVGTKRVADALDMPVSACEQDYDLYKFRWFAENRGVDTMQPDVFYSGGILRTLRIADIACEHGIPVLPHSPKADPVAGPMLHVAAAIGNAGPFNEFHIDPAPRHGWYSPYLEIKDGAVAVPDGPGLGFAYDPDFIRRGRVVFSTADAS
jgi:L-alanine-DL-glutamate epimerase-like enolase superfamily enzyme